MNSTISSAAQKKPVTVLKPGMTAPSADDSELLKELRACERKPHEFDIAEIVGAPSVRKVWVRAATKKEQDRALAGAHAYVAKLTTQTPEAAKDDEFVVDAKQAAIVAETFRVSSAATALPVWPNAESVCEVLTPRQIAALANIASAVRFREPPALPDLSDEAVEAFAQTASQYVATDMPDVLLAMLPREHLTQLAIMLAHKLVRERAEREPAPTIGSAPPAEEHEFIPDGDDE